MANTFPLVFVLLASVQTCFTVQDNKHNKRILMADPDNSDNVQMHKDIQALKSTVSQLQELNRNTVNQLQQLNQEFASKMTDVQTKLQSVLSAPTGSVYTQWGRKSCTKNGTDLVYSGLGAGGKYSEVGRSALPVCVPHNPENGQVSLAKTFGTLFGMEYNDRSLGQNLYDKDVPCAVCRTNYASSVLTIPGRKSCYKGWNMEYTGLLVAGHHADAGASSYICLDQSPEALEGGFENSNGYNIFPVKAYCGSLRCPPYIQYSEVHCVVCSK